MNLVKNISLLVVSIIVMASCADGKKKETDVIDETEIDTTEVIIEESEMVGGETILDVTMMNESFKTFVNTMRMAGILETLAQKGPFTVFAPTNDAFLKLPTNTVELLLKPESNEKLKSILNYHVISGKFVAAAVIDEINKNNGIFSITTIQGDKIDFSMEDGKVILTDSSGNASVVTMPDLDASNGVIHGIDSVLMPK